LPLDIPRPDWGLLDFGYISSHSASLIKDHQACFHFSLIAKAAQANGTPYHSPLRTHLSRTIPKLQYRRHPHNSTAATLDITWLQSSSGRQYHSCNLPALPSPPISATLVEIVFHRCACAFNFQLLPQMSLQPTAKLKLNRFGVLGFGFGFWV